MQVHFIAIGGSVMHQLAISLKRKGYIVTGSDDEIFEPARSNLQKEGILPASEGWFPEKLRAGIDAVILGMHAKVDNPEIQKAKALGLNIYSFPEYIYQESQVKKRVAVGGSHGKTSTTAMIMHVLKYAGEDFDYLVGASLPGFELSVSITDAPVIICEADEYPASTLEKRPKFHFLFPHVAVITGIAWDHINVFPTFENYLLQFTIFIEKIPAGGLLIYNGEDETLRRLIEENKRGDIIYHPYCLPEFIIENGVTTIMIDGIQTKLKVFGNHNLLNMQAAYAVCKNLGVESKAFSGAISQFTGAAKRLEVLFNSDKLTVYRDFAHAPSKVAATMNAVRHQFPHKNIVAVLELHTFSSLNQDFMKEYKGAMDDADQAAVFYSEHALELKRMPFLQPSKVIEGFGRKDLSVITKRDGLVAWLRSQDLSDAVLLFMSSGNYDGLNINEIISS